PVPVYAPDQAAFDRAASGSYRRVVIVASFESALADSVARFTHDVSARGLSMDVRGVVAPDALAATNAGDTDALITALSETCEVELAKPDGDVPDSPASAGSGTAPFPNPRR